MKGYFEMAVWYASTTGDDAPLIAAAPDLLAALELALPYLRWAADRRTDAWPAVDEALEAIEKAKGQ
jgi:hypothetical protein